MWFRRRKPAPDWLRSFIDQLDVFQASLPPYVEREWERTDSEFLLCIPQVTPNHRSIFISGNNIEFIYILGESEDCFKPSEFVCQRVLAVLDALKSGSVREVKDLRTHEVHYVYKLRSRGLREFLQVRQEPYFVAAWEHPFWMKLLPKIRHVKIHTIPPIAETKVTA